MSGQSGQRSSARVRAGAHRQARLEVATLVRLRTVPLLSRGAAAHAARQHKTRHSNKRFGCKQKLGRGASRRTVAASVHEALATKMHAVACETQRRPPMLTVRCHGVARQALRAGGAACRPQSSEPHNSVHKVACPQATRANRTRGAWKAQSCTESSSNGTTGAPHEGADPQRTLARSLVTPFFRVAITFSQPNDARAVASPTLHHGACCAM